MMKELEPDERLTLIELLGQLPDVESPGQRLSLMDGVDRAARSQVAYSDTSLAHIGSIVNTLGGETFFELADGSYPILTVINNAQSRVKATMLYNKLQAFKEKLSNRFSLSLLRSSQPLNRESTSLQIPTSPFQQELLRLIQAIVELCEQLQSAAAIFSSDVLPAQCRAIKASITVKCIPIYTFALSLRQSDNLPLEIVAHDIWLRKELAGFDRETKALEIGLDYFEKVEVKLLRQSQEKRKEIQQSIAILLQRCASLLGTLKELQSILDKQSNSKSEHTDTF